ncbi:uncharacterized protein TNCV_4931891 [Trichonephila clavipes]|nr:uncharacterized protein TNCV_4931891 [Trichonephila clavipes]
MSQMETESPDITNSCGERSRISPEIEGLDIIISHCTELINQPDTDDNQEMKAILQASIDDAQRKKDALKKKRKIKKDSAGDCLFTKKTARPVSPLISEPVTVNNRSSDLESENDKEQVAPEENNETAIPKPKPPPPIHLKMKENIRDQLKYIYRKFPGITNKTHQETSLN